MWSKQSLLLFFFGASLLPGVNGDKDHHPENAGCPIPCHHGKCVEVGEPRLQFIFGSFFFVLDRYFGA